MYCQNCGKEISDDSTFCVYCGAKTGAAPQTQQQAKPNATIASIQNNESVQKAQQSLMSGFSAILAVLKDPKTVVSLGIGEMIVIGVIAVIAHTLFTAFAIMGVGGQIISSTLGAFSSYIRIPVNVIMCILSGIVITAFLVCGIAVSHCVEDKSFAKFTSYLSGSFIGCILPSAAMLLAGLCAFISVYLFAFFLVLALIAYLTYLLKSFNKTNQYIVILYTTVVVVVIAMLLIFFIQHAIAM